MKKYIWPLLLLAFTISCDTIDDPLKNDLGFIDLPDSTNKVVLIEEFTGADCNNCPNAVERIHDYLESFPGRLVVLSIHESNFAVPDAEHPIDYRVPEGTELYKFFAPIGVPSGMFDRKGYPDSHSKLLGDWDNAITAALAEKASIEINASFQYDTLANEIRLQTSSNAVERLENNEDLYLSAFLIEDSIISPQTMPNGSIKEDYVHMHMLRAGFNGPWGTSVPSGSVPEHNEFSLAIKPEWNLKNCSAVVFVYDRNTHEVLQAHHAHYEN